MKIEDFIGEKVIFDEGSQMIFGVNKKGKQQLLLDVRGWGAIQHLFKEQKDATKFQDEFGMWIVDAINAKLSGETIAVKEAYRDVLRLLELGYDNRAHVEIVMAHIRDKIKELPISTPNREQLLDKIWQENIAGKMDRGDITYKAAKIVVDATVDTLLGGDNGWISVDKELPKNGEYVIAYVDGWKPFIALFQGTTRTNRQVWLKDYYMFDKKVTHWMPLPSPPTNNKLFNNKVR